MRLVRRPNLGVLFLATYQQRQRIIVHLNRKKVCFLLGFLHSSCKRLALILFWGTTNYFKANFFNA